MACAPQVLSDFAAATINHRRQTIGVNERSLPANLTETPSYTRNDNE